MPKISTLLFILSLTCPILAQESFSSSDLYGRIDYNSILSGQSDFLNKYYFQNIDNIDELVNGKDYVPYYFKSKSIPILFFDRKHKSSLTLNGRKYDNLMLEYDTFMDELIYSDSLKFIDNKVFKISLNKDPVDGFIFTYENDTLFFRYFSSEEDVNFNLPEGFYESCYEGRSKFIIKHRSHLLVKEGIDEYIYSPASYIMINKGYTKIGGKKAFLKVFGDKSGEIKKYLRANKVNIHKADKNAIATVLKYYDSMTLSNR